MGSIPGLGRSPGKEYVNPLQCSSVGNPTDRGAWWTTVHGVAKESDMTEGLKTTTRNQRSIHTLSIVTTFSNLYMKVFSCIIDQGYSK